MNLLVLKIVLIFLTIRIVFLIIKNLVIIFWDKATKDCAAEILKDPEDYIREDHICKFMVDMIWLYLFIKALIGVYAGQITIN